MRAAVENWAALGAERALTGPIARGDEETVARQRAAVAERTPDLLPLFDALVDATRAVVAVKTIRTIAEMRAHVAPRARRGRTVGLVPTMGAFHAGHHSLMRAARERCDEVVVSLFVNPAQFNDSADLAAYPRSEDARRRRGGRAGRRRAVRAVGGGGLPARVRHVRARRGPVGRARGRRSAARTTSPASAPS